MPVKIRLMRIGAKKRPFYRVVAVDERKKRTGQYIELLGTYNPLTEPKEIILKKDRLDWWISQGAVPSDGYLRIMKQAPQKPPRKPKKEKEEKAPAPTALVAEESEKVTVEESAPSEEVSTEAPTEETPQEEVTKTEEAVVETPAAEEEVAQTIEEPKAESEEKPEEEK